MRAIPVMWPESSRLAVLTSPPKPSLAPSTFVRCRLSPSRTIARKTAFMPGAPAPEKRMTTRCSPIGEMTSDLSGPGPRSPSIAPAGQGLVPSPQSVLDCNTDLHDARLSVYSTIELLRLSILIENFVKVAHLHQGICDATLGIAVVRASGNPGRAGTSGRGSVGRDERAGDQPAQPVEAAEVSPARGAAVGPAVAGAQREDLGADRRRPARLAGGGRAGRSLRQPRDVFGRRPIGRVRRCGLLAAS